jgi:hypothetical protein
MDDADDASATRLRFGVGGGAIVPRSKARFQDVLAGATGQAFLLVRFAPGFPALRIGADYSRMTFGEPAVGATGSIYGQTRSQFAGIVSIRFDLAPGPVRPYLLAGAGAFSIRDAIEVRGSLAGGSAISTTDFGLEGGGGISFRFGRIRSFVEARIQNVYTKEGFINTKSIQAIPVTFGLIF